MAEHTGCEEAPDIMRNTRTTLTVAPLRWIGWQMPFHVEHHLFPNVPFHALPKLHQRMGDRIEHLETDGYVRGHLKILSALAHR